MGWENRTLRLENEGMNEENQKLTNTISKLVKTNREHEKLIKDLEQKLEEALENQCQRWKK